MAAKASEVMGLGKGVVTEMGRWREKKADAAISAGRAGSALHCRPLLVVRVDGVGG